MQLSKEWKGRNINSFKKILSAYNFLSIYILILIVYNLFLLNLPLTNFLGYEFSIFNSALIIILAGFYSVFFLKKTNINGETLSKIINSFTTVSIIFILGPFLISFLSLFRTITCPIKDGILFYAFLTVPAPVIGIALGLIGFSISKKFSLLVFILALFLIALIPVLEIYFNPQIYFYNPIVGFFPGTIYDEGIEVDFKLMIYRVLILIFFLSIIFLILRALIYNSRYSLKVAWIYSIVVPIAFVLLAPDLGYSTTHSRIKDELDKTIFSEHYEIHYSSKLNDTLINVIALHHEFYHAELEKYFNLKFDGKIRSIIFNTREQKKRLFGTANADVAKPWIPEIYIIADNYDKTLKHELAHCFAGDFGSNVFKVADNFNPSLIEGIAMAADPTYDAFDLDFMAALAFSNEFELDVNSLFKSFNFFKQPSSLGYIIAGSFIKYLNDKYGIERFKKLYTDIDFGEYYAKELPELAEEFEYYLRNNYLIAESDSDRAKYYYGRKSIFYKVCPRYVAKQLNKAWKFYNNNRIDEAEKIFEELLPMGESYSPLIGMAYCYVEKKEPEKAISLLKEKIHKFENTAYNYEIEFLLADLLAKNNLVEKADSLYKILVTQNPNRVLFSLAYLRNDLINTNNVINYLNGKNKEKYEIIRSLNLKNYNYNSFPHLASLAGLSEIKYEDFLKNFSKTLEVSDYNSSYGIYNLSLYMCEKMDLERARKMASLALRYSKDKSFNSVLRSNFDKMNWLYKNAAQILSALNYF